MNRAATTSLPSQVCFDAPAEVTAVVPRSQITFDMAAAHGVLENIMAPMPHSVHGLIWLSAAELTEGSATKRAEAATRVFILFIC